MVVRVGLGRGLLTDDLYTYPINHGLRTVIQALESMIFLIILAPSVQSDIPKISKQCLEEASQKRKAKHNGRERHTSPVSSVYTKHPKDQ